MFYLSRLNDFVESTAQVARIKPIILLSILTLQYGITVEQVIKKKRRKILNKSSNLIKRNF